MTIKKNMSISDYVKIGEMKNFIMSHLEKMGLHEQVRTMSDDDLEKIMFLMSTMAEQLRGKGSDVEKLEMLISYLICMWCKLIVDYGADLKEM